MSEALFSTEQELLGLFAGDGSKPEPTGGALNMVNTLDFYLISSNVKGWPYMPQRHVVHDTKAIANYAGSGAVHFGQEAWLGRYNAAWIAAMAARGFHGYNVGPVTPPSQRFDGFANPIFLDPDIWTVRHAYTRYMHEAIPGISPIRIASIVQTQRHGFPIAFVNCHPISQIHDSNLRYSKWVEYWEKLHTILDNLYAEGFNLFYGGDINNTNPPQQFHDQIHLASHKNDHLWARAQKGITIEAAGESTRAPGYTDHLTILSYIKMRKS